MKNRYARITLIALASMALAKPAASGTPGDGHASPSVGGPAAPSGSSPVAAITGTVKVVGQVAKPQPINMAQEPACAKLHPAPALNVDVVVGSSGTLGNVIVYISAGLGDRAFDPPNQPLEIDQKGCMYSPHIIALQTNQKLRVLNSDPTMHNIHPIPANNREWNKSQPASTPPIETSFAREEITIPVKCNVHPWMRSYIAVFKHPYFAVTDKEGSFELKNLPPGSYTITAWHEKFGISEQKVTIAPNESKKLEFVFKAKG